MRAWSSDIAPSIPLITAISIQDDRLFIFFPEFEESDNFCKFKMTRFPLFKIEPGTAMAELNACSECGFTSTCIQTFTSHIEQHEEEHRSSGELSHSQTTEWTAGSSGSDSSTPSPTGSLSDPEKGPSIQRPMPSLELDRKLELLHELSTLKNEPSVIKELTSKNGSKTVHVCPHCNFTTYMSQHMKSHLEAHERHQGQMYQCDICHMQFSQKANMHRHRMRHTGVKPYECRYCKKRFFRKDQMQEHSMTHIKTGADFDCPVSLCVQQFSQHSQLRAHLDEAHNITPASPASCKRCSLLFANSRRLLLHYQTRHDENEESSPSPLDKEMDSPQAKKSRPIEFPTTTFPTRKLIEDMVKREIEPLPERIENPIMPAPIYPPISSEDLLMMCLANNTALAHPALLAASKLQLAGPLRMWTEQLTQPPVVAPVDEEAHSPSLDSGSSNVEVVEEAAKPATECSHCGINFGDTTMYMLHKGLHSDGDPWKCNLCGVQCGEKYMFSTHVIFASHST